MSNAYLIRAEKTAGGKQDGWSGSDPTQYFKTGPNPQLTHWGRKAILELWDGGLKSPLRIAVRTGIPNRLVQYILSGLRDFKPHFSDHEYYQHITFNGGTYDGG